MFTCTLIHTPKCQLLLIFYLPCSIAFLPVHSFSLYSLLGVALAKSLALSLSLSERNAAPCDLSPTIRRDSGLDKGARGSCSHVPRPGSKHIDPEPGCQFKCTHSNCNVLFWCTDAVLHAERYFFSSLSLCVWEIVECHAFPCVYLCVRIWTHEWSAASHKGVIVGE